jgi:hypothetical protein
MMMMMEMMPITRRSSCGGRKTDRQNANARMWRCDRLQYRRKSLIENGKGEEEVEERPFLRHRQSQRVCVCVCGGETTLASLLQRRRHRTAKKKRKKKRDLTDKASQNYTKHKTKPKRASGGGGGLGGGQGEGVVVISMGVEKEKIL